MRLRVTYGNPDELIDDFERQMVKGGLLVRVPPPDDLELFSGAKLTVAYEGSEAVSSGRVLQALPGLGVAVSIDDPGALDDLLRDARARRGAGGPAAEHEVERDVGAAPPFPVEADSANVGETSTLRPDAPPASQAEGDAAPPSPSEPVATEPPRRREPSRAPPPAEAHQRVRDASKPELIRMARYGVRAERMLIIRGSDSSLHRFVLANPHLGLDEVRSIAAMSTLSAEILIAVADRTDWSHRPDIALALVRNPKTPIPVAIKLLPHVPMNDLRQLSKTSRLRMPLLREVRRRINA